ncbi:MAG: phytanoyl-CoA dioxygenase, partial [Pseudomonadota bacterium]
MKRFTPETVDADAIVAEMLHGDGAVLLSGLFTDEQIADARRIVIEHSEQAAEKVTHFQGGAEADGTLGLQRRVWNLLAKGAVFSEMAAHPVLMTILRKFL